MNELLADFIRKLILLAVFFGVLHVVLSLKSRSAQKKLDTRFEVAMAELEVTRQYFLTEFGKSGD